MIVIACVDQRGGMRFNRRRVSRDRAVCERVLERTADSRLWMSGYTAGLFAGLIAPQICVNADFLDRAGAGEFCFAEDPSFAARADRIEQLILYRWNRVYPADEVFPLLLDGWRRSACTLFPGNSHETVAEEVYDR